MNKELFENLTLVASVFLIAPLILSIFRYKFLIDQQKKLLFLICITIIVEIVSWILWYQKMNNLPLYHFYTIIEFLLIVNIYKTVLSKTFPKWFFNFLSIGFSVFAIVNILFLQNLNTFNSNATTLLSILVIFFSLSYFYTLLKEVRYSALETNPMFWINSGFLIYFSSNLILFFINNNLFKGSTEASYLVWGLHAIVNIVLTLFYTIALWVNPKKQLL
ncbi:hypothetical protein [Aquimarina sp. 2201CG5-10]|uniref:hypothetical protein n=1 Tax=Aquimarina callyspongiae TaxID=3098150 RepID=UPI002AB39B58|nr:hypothetical protein [Aquimarina sp. 2201CG5-10]MDY8135173.1 hypothetical protein [Aquimarina sp. 2201CG5-10]